MKRPPCQIAPEKLREIVLFLRYGGSANDSAYILKSISYISRLICLPEDQIKAMLADREPDLINEPLPSKPKKKRLDATHIAYLCNSKTLKQ